jgi:hypothetical protein
MNPGFIFVVFFNCGRGGFMKEWRLEAGKPEGVD